jgi:hypothetical protein
MDFIGSSAPGTDIFCFQEVTRGGTQSFPDGRRAHVLADITNVLPEFADFYAPMFSTPPGIDEDITVGTAIFVRRSFSVSDAGAFFAHGELRPLRLDNDPHSVGFVQHLRCTRDEREFLIVNVHGIAVWPKADTPERLDQSRRIRAFTDAANVPAIICGDLNLFPDTESVRMLAKDMRDLTAEYAIPTTRSDFHMGKSFKSGSPIESTSDYCFVSPGITVRSFSVPNVEVSDHLPLILEFS